MLSDLDLGCVYVRGGEGGGVQVGGLEAPPWRLPSTKVTTCCGMAIPSPAPAPVRTP